MKNWVSKRLRSIVPPVDILFSSSRKFKASALLILDMCFIPCAIWLAVIARWGGLQYTFGLSDYIAAGLTVVLSVSFFLKIGLYRAIIRFMGQQAILTIIKGVTFSALVLAIAAFLCRSDIPRSTPVIYWAITLIMIGGSRLVVRALDHGVMGSAGEKAVIYGAGESGQRLLAAIFPRGEYCPVGMVDDDRNIVGSVINGVSVYHPDQLLNLIEEFSVSHVFLALPSVARERRREIILKLEGLPVHVKTVPDFSELMMGTAKVGQLRDIELEDLLGREVVPPDQELMSACITDKVVMVSGGGGSIGSELCRQIIHCRPRELVLLDISEYSLYAITRELEAIKQRNDLTVKLVPLLGTVQNSSRMRSIMSTFKVDTIYHAAAYKHVPMVEHNIVAGVNNNVMGTLALGKAAAKEGVKNFVLISTDKAVRPTSVMGASKRMAELVLQAFAKKYTGTQFCMVRFGNVLGSSGSVVPLFRQQIQDGGPVTVTHKDITRYFMTIPEAAQLVLQAGAMGEGGDVFVLDMSEPVKILDLARRLIHLMGMEVKDDEHPEGDIEIHLTGLRAGEKLFEELLLGDNVTGTGHPKIMRAEEEQLDEELVDNFLADLKNAALTNNCQAIRDILAEAVTGFQSADGIVDALWVREKDSGSEKNVVRPKFKHVE